MRLVFATHNAHKLNEVRNILCAYAEEQGTSPIELMGLEDLKCYDDIPENESTLEGNARAKADFVFSRFSVDCFADDTGLEIEALGGEPGVYSARYAGEGHDSFANRKKVMDLMQGICNRKARFRTVVALRLGGEEHLFEGVVNGIITESEHGTGGFGYDSIFQPDGFDRTFAELDIKTKNSISHRGMAIRKLVEFLVNYKK